MLRPSRRLVLSLLATSALALPFAGNAAALTPVRPANPILPVNQATRDAALVKAIAACLAAAKARNFAALSRHVDEKIQLDYGGGAGRAEMGRRLAKSTIFWDELVWVLENGGRFERDGTFWAPYTYGVPVGKLDVFEAGIVIGTAAAHAEPRADAPVVAQLDRSVVKVTDWKNTDRTPSPFYRRQDWVEIELADKRKAWMPAKSVRSVVDFRAGFEKKRGAWKVIMFIAGD